MEIQWITSETIEYTTAILPLLFCTAKCFKTNSDIGFLELFLPELHNMHKLCVQHKTIRDHTVKLFQCFQGS